MNAFVKLRQKDQPVPVFGAVSYRIRTVLILSVCKTIYLSLYKTDKLGQAKLFVGFGNYISICLRQNLL